MIKQILTIFILFTFSNLYSQNLSINEIESAANDMLISKKYKTEVIKVSENVKNIKVALLTIPYREFPSIIIFKRNNSDNWIRVFEGLSPGIQDEPSGLKDWHTDGLGIDFLTDDDTELDFLNEKVITLIEGMNQSDCILIPYQNFFHFHSSDSISAKKFEPYTIDKTLYFDFANQIFSQRYLEYPKDQCVMFDSPKTTDFSFDFIDGKYIIEAKTDNDQIWQYSFSGIDGQFKLLLDKKIKIKYGS